MPQQTTTDLNSSENHCSNHMDRREFLATACKTAAASALWLTASQLTACGGETDSSGRLLVLKAGQSLPDGGKAFTYNGEGGWLIKNEAGQLVAFSNTCTHMACQVVYSAEAEIFQCPCHGGQYNQQGQVMSGPPPLPLKPFAVQQEANGQVWVMGKS